MAESDNARLIVVLEAQSKKLQNSLVQVNRQIDRFAQQTERRLAQMQKNSTASFERLSTSLRTSIGGLQSVLGPLIGAIGVREVINYADAWQEAENKIAAAAQVSGQFAKPLEQVKDAANSARTDLASYVDLYARLLRVSPNVAASEVEVARATDIVAKSLKAGGAAASEQAATLTQLGQALGSGVLQGDELRSLRENAPLIVAAIAEEFGVTIGQLKELGAEGKLTSDRVFKAILAGGEDIEAAFKATQSTIKDAFTRIDNELTAYIANAGEAGGATQGLIDALNFLADNFKETADVVVQFATVVAGALAGRAIAGIVIGIGNAVGAIGAFIVALRAGTLAAGGFTAALGPIGIIAGIAAAAIFLLNQANEEGARKAAAHAAQMTENGAAIEVARDASAEYRKALRDQIAMQVEAARAALTEADAVTRSARAKAAASKVNILGMTFSDPFANGAAESALQTSIALDGAYQELEAQLLAIDEIMTTPAGSSGSGGGGAISGKLNDYQKAIEKLKERTADLQAETAAQAGLNPLLNDYGFALERARAAQDLLNAAKSAGLAITPELKAAIDELAVGYANTSVAAAKLSQSQDKVREAAVDMRDTLKDATRSFVDDLIAGRSAAEALGNVLNQLGNKLIGLGLDSIFGSGGQDFGLLGGLFGFASGGYTGGGGKYQPAGIVHRGEYVFDQDATRRIGVSNLEAISSGRAIGPPGAAAMRSSGVMPSITYAPQIDARGADTAAIARLDAALAKDRAEFQSKVVGAVRRARATANL